ncbi:MAG: glycerophosphodiester phosphodiesterase family protein [Rubripirellula sp.]
MKKIFGAALDTFRRRWRKLFIADILYKIIAFVLLTPLIAILFQAFVGLSGNNVLADQDVLYFLLGPIGWICLILVGALWLGIVALEQAALLAILATPSDKKISVIQSLQFASAHAWQVSQVTGRLILKTVMVSAPFLAVAAGVYFLLLTEFDINYYLKEQPNEFKVAVAIGVVLACLLGAVLLRLFSGWYFALPLVLFEDIPPRLALKESQTRASGHRRKVLSVIVFWGVATLLISSLTTSLVIYFGRLLVPQSSGSLSLLVVAIGISLLVWTVVNLLINLLSTTTFAALLLEAYRRIACDGEIDTTKLKIVDADQATARFQITKKRVLVASLVGILIAAMVGVVAARSVRLNDDVEIIAHRGASASAPENTMAAIRQAIDDQADWVEIDVQETADGKIVVFHDSDFMKLAGVDLKIWDANLSDLEAIDIGSSFDPAFQDERVPTLDDVLAECKGKVGVNIELKYYGHDQSLEQRVIEIVEAQQMSSDVIYMSLKLDAVKKMKRLRPDCRAGLLMSVAAGDLKTIEADFLAVNAGFVDRRFVRQAHASDKDVYVWTVNDAVAMSSMVGRGVDGLITDHPALARSVLEQRAQLSPAERLMIELAETFGVQTAIADQ